MQAFSKFSLLLLFVFICYISPVHAQITCSKIFENTSVRLLSKEELRDSSVEVEISGPIIDLLFTTRDGTLKPVLERLGENGIPKDMLVWLKEIYPDTPLKNLAWDLFSPEEKAAIIMNVAKVYNQQFYQNRRIRGLVYRNEIKLTFQKKSRFMGRDYYPGTYKFKSEDIFSTTAIEFMSPSKMTENLGFELHIRRSDGAAENYETAKTLQRALIGAMGSVHQHVVAPMPLDKLKRSPLTESWRLTEFYRRLNYLAQFIRILNNFEITLNKDEYGERMPILRKIDLEHIQEAFRRTGENLNFNHPPYKLEKKSGLVGLRIDTYSDFNLWGIEFRDLSPRLNQAWLHLILDKTQARMIRDELGISDEEIKSINPSKYMYPEIDYYLTHRELVPDLVPYSKVLNEYTVNPIMRALERKKQNVALGLLLHDWSQDPLLIKDPKLKFHVMEVQDEALKRILHYQDPTEALGWFIKKSGLFRHLFKIITDSYPENI